MSDVTICVLTCGDYPDLARRVIRSIARCSPRSQYQLFIGANAACAETIDYIAACHGVGAIDQFVLSESNLNKCPMMRRLFGAVTTEFIWWFDDDSYLVDPTALDSWIHVAQAAPPETVLWGTEATCSHPAAFAPDLDDAVQFVRTAPWYRGLPPPSWKPGGKGELDFEGRGTGDGRWCFILGGCWLIRTAAVRALDWPDKRLVKSGDDVFLGEAIRQQGWTFGAMHDLRVAIDTEPRRGDVGVARLTLDGSR